MKKTLFITILLIAVFIFASPVIKDYKIIKLKNGLEVIMVKNENQPIVTIEIAARNGAYTQSHENCGLSHLYEHMFFKGNKKWQTQEEYQKRVRELGIIYNGVTSNEAVRYFFTLPSRNIKEGLEFMAYAIQEPLFDTTELRKEKNVVMNEFKRDFSTPDYTFWQEVEKAMFTKYFYRKNAIGDRNIIENATQEQMKEIQKKFYMPNNCALIIVGDINYNETEKYVKEYFNDWQKGEKPNFKFPEHPYLKEDKKILVVKDVNVAKLDIMYRGPDVDTNRKDTYVMDILTEIIGKKSAPLHKKLVDSGLVYDLYAGYYTQQDGGTFIFYVELKPENIDTVIKIIDNEIENMTKKDYFTKNMIEEAIQSQKIGLLYNIESTQRFALNIAFYWCVSDIDYFLDYFDNIKKIKSKDLSNIVKKYLYKKHRVIGALVNGKAAETYFDNSWKESGK